MGEVGTTRAWLIERRAHLIAEANPIRAALAEIDREVRQIDRCLSAMDAPSHPRRDTSVGTIQDIALNVLATAPEGLHVNDLLADMQRIKPDLVRTSLAPQLSRLKRDGRVMQLPRAVWALPDARAAGPAPRGDGR